jgi:hypothetical protein
VNATSFALFELVWQDLLGWSDAHTDIRIVFVFTNVVFLGVSHMTYCSETRDTKSAMRERVNSRATGSSPGRLIEITFRYLAPLLETSCNAFQVRGGFLYGQIFLLILGISSISARSCNILEVVLLFVLLIFVLT